MLPNTQRSRSVAYAICNAILFAALSGCVESEVIALPKPGVLDASQTPRPTITNPVDGANSGVEPSDARMSVALSNSSIPAATPALLDLGKVVINKPLSTTITLQNNSNTQLAVSFSANCVREKTSDLTATLSTGAKKQVTFLLNTTTVGSFGDNCSLTATGAGLSEIFVIKFSYSVVAAPLNSTPTASSQPATPSTPTTPATGPTPTKGPTSTTATTSTANIAVGAYSRGINWNIPSSLQDIDYDTLVDTAVKDLGVNAVRFYMGVDFSQGANWLNGSANGTSNRLKFESAVKVAKLLRAKNIHVTMVVTPPAGTDIGAGALPPQLKKPDGSLYANYEAAKAAGRVPANVCGLLTSLYNDGGSAAVNMWELGNEVNLNLYWQRNSDDSTRVMDYIETYLKPGADCLHSLNSKAIVSTAGFTSIFQNSIQLVTDRNGFNYADVAAFHLYINKSGTHDVAGYVGAFDLVRAALPKDKKNIPLAVTEWSGYYTTAIPYKGAHVLTNSEASDWAEYNDKIIRVIKTNAAIAHYFTIQYDPDALHGKCAAYSFRNNTDGSRAHNAKGFRIFDKVPFFHDSIASWSN